MLRAALLVLVTLASVLIPIAMPHQAFAASTTENGAETATTTPTPNATAQQVASPVITNPSAGAFIGSSTTTVSGTRDASSEVQLLSPTGGDPLCIIAPDGTTRWSCRNASLPSFSAVTLRVVVTGDSTLSDEITVTVLAPPTVTGGVSNGLVRGTGHPGASVTVTVANGADCTTTADGSGAWACYLDGVTSSGSRDVSARQRAIYSGQNSSNPSPTVSIAFDIDRPNPPIITAPAAGTQIPVAGTTYVGTGENGTTVTVFAGAYSVCTTTVTAGAWTCTVGGIAVGSYSLVAVQQDAAGNVSRGSPGLRVAYVAPPAPTATRTPTPSPRPSGMATPVPEASIPSPSATGDAAPVAPVPTPSPSASSEGPAAGVTPGQWNAPTRFTAAVSSPFTTAPFPWLQAVLLALGAMLLLALPARLLAGTISRARGGRPLWSATSIAGRNRARDEFETAPTVQLNRWLLGGAALVAAATLVMLSGPVVSQPAYLRLLVAVIVALLLVNLSAAVVPLWWSTRVMHIDATITFLPRYLALVAVAAIGSRVLDIHPVLLFGLLGSVTIAAGPTIAQRGQLAAVRAASLMALAIVGWTTLGALPTAAGLVSSLVAEIVNTVVLASIGSAVLVLVPLGRTSGRSVLAWSPLFWAGLMVAAFTLLFAVLSPVIDVWQSAGRVPLLWVAAGIFAALSGGAWAWQRFVAPTQL
ncbi:Ig-like domain-containing protein [Cryobacterium psychrophilum]|uniref:Uncharacterized protein n=1 Tax=Cryobacterium psychrophilum TaxID=41988 RepID=A0A4Y8KJ27_9MICO|nr:Ig-like domain-containing protein [Cryobacterium psychrophilum]TDW30810.1 hypothetical protein EDD25_2586 [Cryobacterium psychrophilum]TFD75793.1 hypothetical protein E3T53_15080 [Cryobacterium psychrophilum]